MRVSKDLERQLLSDPRCTVGPTAAIPTAPETDEKPVKLVTPLVVMDGLTLRAFVPVETRSETNQRDWKARSRRGGAAWKAVSRTFGPWLDNLAYFATAYHYSDSRLRITFTRLGGRKMDHSNLPAAMKAVEDALAFMLGADDGDSRWLPVFFQEPGGSVGVRIEIQDLGLNVR